MSPCRWVSLFLALSTVLLLALAPARAADETYVIGVEDVLDIQVWDNKDLNQVVFVRPDGKISLPFVGEIQAGGKTVQQLQDALAQQYAKSVKDANVTVVVKEIKSRPVYFSGEFAKTGPVQLTRNLTVLQAISVVGGLLPTADAGSGFVLRDGKVIPIDFTRLIQMGDVSQNLKLEPGDSIVAPTAESVYVQGEVKTPKVIKLTKDLTILRAISEAGGVTEHGAPSQVVLIRRQGDQRSRIPVNLDKLVEAPDPNADLPLKPNDVIFVPFFVSPTAESVYVQGEVKTPKVIKLTKDLTVLRAISDAGGVTQLAASSRVVIIRGEGDKRERIQVDLDKLMKEPDTGADVPLKPNDVIFVPQRLF
jgi:polysaccharide export outer membrane protein